MNHLVIPNSTNLSIQTNENEFLVSNVTGNTDKVNKVACSHVEAFSAIMKEKNYNDHSAFSIA